MSNTTRRFLMGASGVGKKSYIDDVFSTYLYKGTESTHAVNNGIDLSTEGGLVWIKARAGTTQSHSLVDTERGAGYQIESNTNTAQTYEGTPTFNTNGFTVVGAGGQQNANGADFASWTFRKQKGFFDVVKYNGDGNTSQEIPHGLGSVPGCIFVKCFSNAGTEWMVYHRGVDPEDPANYRLLLDQNVARVADLGAFNNTEPTATHFTVGDAGNVNNGSRSYIAYLFAGGASTAATSPSVDFDGSNDSVTIPESTDWLFEEDDFTIEFWVKFDQLSIAGAIVSNMTNFNSSSEYNSRWVIGLYNSELRVWTADNGDHILHDYNPTVGAWTHYAITRESGNKFTLYKNGNNIHQVTQTCDLDTNGDLRIGYLNNLGYHNGKISNLRITKGQAVYTSSFRAPTEPLTTTSQGATSSNVKVLCLNNSSVTGATVTPGTITNNGASASIDSPFDDLQGFKFGEEGDQNIIKCGTYEGNENANGPEIYLGWKPQWLLFKNADTTDGWAIFDSMRGVVTGDDDNLLYANTSNDENGNQNYLNLTSTGFKPTYANDLINGLNKKTIFIAIRGTDGLVSKLPEVGTDVFTIDTGQDSATIPNFDSGFPVDFAIARNPSANDNNLVGTRMTGPKYLITNSSGDGTNDATGWSWDSNLGWNNHGSYSAAYYSWMWKRYAGFEVVTYTGNGSTTGDFQDIPHNLGRVPEMVWIKRRSAAAQWSVGHKGLNGGTNPWHYSFHLDSNVVEVNYPTFFDTAPTSNVVTVGDHGNVNENTNAYVMMLFASIEGISKVGSFDGSNSTQTITTGFAPRMLIIKRASGGTGDWFLWDTLRGWTAGNDPFLELNDNTSQVNFEAGAPTATGFTITNYAGWSESGSKYIYYAHA